MEGLTFDTGALIAPAARRMPTVAIAEWCRGPNRAQDDLLRPFSIEPATTVIAKLAGTALAAVPEATTIDAIIMATAATRGGIVYTSHPDDLGALRDGFFKAVKVFKA